MKDVRGCINEKDVELYQEILKICIKANSLNDVLIIIGQAYVSTSEIAIEQGKDDAYQFIKDHLTAINETVELMKNGIPAQLIDKEKLN